MTKQSSIPDFGWCRHVGKGGYMSPTQHYWRVNSAAICGAAFRYKTLCLAYLAVSPSRLIETTRRRLLRILCRHRRESAEDAGMSAEPLHISPPSERPPLSDEEIQNIADALYHYSPSARYTVSAETLQHFCHINCPEGPGYWSIGDGDPNRAYYCPYCGIRLELPA